MNELQERLEGKLITRTFHISGMPESVWKEINSFCLTHYGDVRWVMLKDLINLAKIDWKYEMLFDEIMTLKEEIAKLKEQDEEEVGDSKFRVKTFGNKGTKGE